MASGKLSAWEEGKAFCHKGAGLYSTASLARLWTTLRTNISLTPSDGAIISRGNSSERALSGDEAPTNHRNGTHYLYLSPFNVDCVGIVPESGEAVRYKVSVKKTFAYERLVLFCFGLLLFFVAPRMARLLSNRE